LGTGDSGSADDRKARASEGRGRSGDRVAGRHQVVDDDHPRRSGRSALAGASDELAHRSGSALRRRQLDAVRPVCGQPENRRDAGGDAAPAQGAGRVPGQPLDVLSTPAAGRRNGGRNRDQPHRTGVHLDHSCCQRERQRPRQIATLALLVRQQARPHDAGVGPRHRYGRQTRRGRVRTVSPRAGERLPAPLADGPAGIGASDARAREGQIGQDGEHATTVPPSAGSR
jgi:hypothetical protein